MAEDKPTGRTKYPRQYIIDRIDARIASLRSRDDAKDTLVEQNELRKAEENRQWIADVERRSQDASLAAADAREDIAARGSQDPRVAQEAAVALHRAMNIPEPPWERRRGWDSKEYKQEQAAAAAINESKQRAREIYSLEHARAYLVDTPVDEFSLHGLRELKLLEVIQFNLGVQEEEQKRRRR